MGLADGKRIFVLVVGGADGRAGRRFLGPVLGLLPGLLPVGGVGREQLAPVAIVLLEQGHLQPGRDRLPAHDDPLVGRAGGGLVGDLAVGADGFAQQAGQFDDVGVLAGLAVDVQGGFPAAFAELGDRGAGAFVQVEPDRVGDLVTGSGVQDGEVVDDLVAGSGAVDGDYQVPPNAAGICSIAASDTLTWSAPVLDPALSSRSITTSSSPVLSHVARSG
jgi:hypothetical protein